MRLKVMLVEDSPMIIKGLQYTIEQAGYDLDVFMSYEHAMRHIYDGGYDLAVLDVTLPDGSGYDICKVVKEDLKIPVIFLTARDTENDVVKGFDMGADDYIIKPFRNRELVSRMETALKKSGKTQKLITIGKVEINADDDIVTVDGKTVDFTPLEFKVLLLLCQNAGRTVSREIILQNIWDMAGNFVNDNTLTVYIKRIREKLGENDIITTVKGIGYKVDKA
jgi:DNA-binding response OmpR family regulator